MPHDPQEKQQALIRVRRIRGQVDGLERLLEEGADCAPILQQLGIARPELPTDS